MAMEATDGDDDVGYVVVMREGKRFEPVVMVSSEDEQPGIFYQQEDSSFGTKLETINDDDIMPASGVVREMPEGHADISLLAQSSQTQML